MQEKFFIGETGFEDGSRFVGSVDSAEKAPATLEDLLFFLESKGVALSQVKLTNFTTIITTA